MEARLANDPVREVRETVGSTIKDLKIYDIFANRMIKLAFLFNHQINLIFFNQFVFLQKLKKSRR